jgi:inorganic pyrophosphatase
MIRYLENLPIHEIEKYSRSGPPDNCIPFKGSPKKHPYDSKKMLLVIEPFSSHTDFYEFNLEDIETLEELPNITNEKGDSVQMVRIWVQKGSFGVRYEPFQVDEPLNFFHDSEIILQRLNEQEGQ